MMLGINYSSSESGLFLLNIIKQSAMFFFLIKIRNKLCKWFGRVLIPKTDTTVCLDYSYSTQCVLHCFAFRRPTVVMCCDLLGHRKEDG